MAIPQNTLIGKTRKSIGNVEFSSWKGINVMKSKPLTVANPRTDLQQQQRSAMAQLVAMARQIPAVLKLGFVQQAVKQSGYNAFISYNIKNAFDMSTPPIATLQQGNILMAKGTIQNFLMKTTEGSASAHSVTLTWESSTLYAGQSANDKLCVVIWNSGNDGYYTFLNNAIRSDNTVTLIHPDFKGSGTGLLIWYFWLAADGKKASDSISDNLSLL